jgi:hypothetical protein
MSTVESPVPPIVPVAGVDEQLQELMRQALDEGWAQDTPLWPRVAMERLVELLRLNGRLLPHGGVVSSQSGALLETGGDFGLITRVRRAGPGANYTRTVTCWPEDTGPNDNWAIYYGPWTWNGVSP